MLIKPGYAMVPEASRTWGGAVLLQQRLGGKDGGDPAIPDDDAVVGKNAALGIHGDQGCMNDQTVCLHKYPS